MRDGLGGIGTVAVIGGGSDIGLAIARALKNLGAKRYVLAGRSSSSFIVSASDLPNMSSVELDLTDLASLESAVDLLFSNGDLDVVVLAAGILEADPDSRAVTEMALVNGAASISLLSLVGDRVRQQGHGHLIILSSMAVSRPRPSNYWYGASKVGLDFAARGLADSFADSTVSVSIIRPGFVHTKMTEGMAPAPFATSPEAIARAVVNQVRNSSSGVVWVPAILRLVATALAWLPRSLLQRLDR